MSSHKFLVHNPGDHVGVAIVDIEKGEEIYGVILSDDSTTTTIVSRSNVPLGHKIALSDLTTGSKVIEYSVPVGVVTQNISIGEYVHTHNLKTARW